ncbi:MAG: hypothetical protein DME60_08070 [Verrucomicrobia bacterium]|nr:MAG: hypothetical protein DME60_08070 [Verrucomicrobiota bacterium]
MSAKPVEVEAASQPWAAKVEQSSLLTHIKATESVLLCVRMKVDGFREIRAICGLMFFCFS